MSLEPISNTVGVVMSDIKAMSELLTEAESLAGRPVEIVQTNDKKYVVEWFSYGYPPPPKSESELGALAGFIGHMRDLKIPPEPEFK